MIFGQKTNKFYSKEKKNHLKIPERKCMLASHRLRTLNKINRRRKKLRPKIDLLSRKPIKKKLRKYVISTALIK